LKKEEPIRNWNKHCLVVVRLLLMNLSMED
jgi:hypothetical protein